MIATVTTKPPTPSDAYSARAQRTRHPIPRHAVRVSRDAVWPHAVFMAWLDSLKEARGIPSDLQLAKVAGISHSSVISGWRSGDRQPGTDNLRKIAKFAGEPAIKVFRLAGIVDDHDLDEELPPMHEPIPEQVQRLLDLIKRSDQNTRTVILGQVEFLVTTIAGR